jgi:hypothetical protein
LEKDRTLRFDNLNLDLVSEGYSSDMHIRIRHPGVGASSYDYDLTMVSGDNYSVELIGTEGVFPVKGNYTGKIYAGDYDDPEIATPEFPIQVLQ